MYVVVVCKYRGIGEMSVCRSSNDHRDGCRSGASKLFAYSYAYFHLYSILLYSSEIRAELPILKVHHPHCSSHKHHHCPFEKT
jgi:hypothetical protein